MKWRNRQKFSQKWMRIIAAVFTLIFIILLESCNSSNNDDVMVKIGYIYSPDDGWQLDALNSVKLFETKNKSYLNCANGRNIKYKIIRYKTDQKPEASVKTFRTAINKDKIAIAVMSLISESALPVAFSAEHSGIPIIAAASTNVQLTRGLKFVRSISTDDEKQAEIYTEYILTRNKNAKVAIIYDVTNPYSRDLASYFRQGFLKKDGELVFYKGYITGTDNLDKLVDLALNKGSNIFVLPNFYKDIKVLIKRIARKSENAKIYGTDSWELNKLEGQPGIEGSFVMDQWHHGMVEGNFVGKKFVRDLETIHGGNITGGMVRSYDALLLMRKTICAAEQPDTYAIANSLRTVNSLEGVAGRYSFDSNGMVDKPMAIVTFKQGKTVFVEALEARRTHQ